MRRNSFTGTSTDIHPALPLAASAATNSSKANPFPKRENSPSEHPRRPGASRGQPSEEAAISELNLARKLNQFVEAMAGQRFTRPVLTNVTYGSHYHRISIFYLVSSLSSCSMTSTEKLKEDVWLTGR